MAVVYYIPSLPVSFTVLRLETHGEGARVFQGPWATTALAAPLGDVQS